MADMELVTVSRLNTYVNRVIRSLEPLKSVYVVGELSNFKMYSSGHCYFSLKDEDAQVKVVMFSSYAKQLKFEPKNGQSVIVHASADYYAKNGSFQLQVFSMELEGLGQLYQRYEALKIKLEEEGLFSAERKQKLPFYPRKIGVITSPSGAVIRDIIHVLSRRNPRFQLLLIPAAVQGDQASGSLVRALELMNTREDIDVIIIGRGGGSLEDLWPFNEEIVARAVASSRIPVVSAVGHETDFSICDFVADLRAPTPSAAAEIIMPESAGIEAEINRYASQMQAALQRRLALSCERLDRLAQSRQLSNPYEIVKLRCDNLKRLIESRALTNPYYLVESRTQYLDLLESKLARASVRLHAGMENRLSQAAAKLDALSPLKVLGRGYALALDRNGQAVQSVKKIRTGDLLDLRMHDGKLKANVTEITSTEDVEGEADDERK